MSTLDVGTATISYETSGPEGAPWLIFSNSLGTNLHMWDAQEARFRDAFRVLRYDQRGHGGSSVPDGDYTMAELGGDVVALMDHLGIDVASFCGLSMGGMTGMWLGVHAGDRFDRLVLANTSAMMPPRDLWDGRIRTVREKGMTAIVEPTAERWFTPAFLQGEPEEADRIRDMILTTDPAGYAGCCAAIRDMDQRGDLAKIDRPTLVIAGERDPSTPPAMAEEIVARIPGARLALLDAAHLSNIEQTEAFDRVLDSFLAENADA